MDTKYFIEAMTEWNRRNLSIYPDYKPFIMYTEMTTDQRSEMWTIAQELKDNENNS